MRKRGNQKLISRKMEGWVGFVFATEIIIITIITTIDSICSQFVNRAHFLNRFTVYLGSNKSNKYPVKVILQVG